MVAHRGEFVIRNVDIPEFGQIGTTHDIRIQIDQFAVQIEFGQEQPKKGIRRIFGRFVFTPAEQFFVQLGDVENLRTAFWVSRTERPRQNLRPRWIHRNEFRPDPRKIGSHEI